LVMRGGLSYVMYDIKLVETGFIVTMYYSKMIYMYSTSLAKYFLLCNENVGPAFI